MTTTITIKRTLLQAVAMASGIKDVRYYLNGVFFEAEAGRVVATNGACLHATESRFDSLGAGDFIAPHDMVSQIIKTKADLVDFAFDGETITAKAGAMSFSGSAIDGKFPDYRRLFKGVDFDHKNRPGFINPALLKASLEAISLAKKGVKKYNAAPTAPVYSPNGMAMMATPEGDFVALVMPMREKVEFSAQNVSNSWARSALVNVRKAA